MAPGVCSDTERDLHLAAQLGRALLERNNELEEKIRKQELDIDQKNLEIHFLTRHVEMLREGFDSYLVQEENNSQELERRLEELEEDKKISRETIKKLKIKTSDLESHCAELELEIEKFTTTQESLTRSRCQCDTLNITYDTSVEDELPKCQSSPIIKHEVMNEINLIENENVRLKNDLEDLRGKYKQEKSLNENLQRDLDQISLEKSFLEEQVNVLNHKLNTSKSLEAELQEWRRENSSPLSENKHLLENECEFEELNIPKGVLVKLGNGVQAYGSEDSFTSVDDFIQVDENDMVASRRPSLLEEILNGDHPSKVATHLQVSEDSNNIVSENAQNDYISTLTHIFGVNTQTNSTTLDSINKQFSSTIAVQTDDCEDNTTKEYSLEPLTNPFQNNFQKTPEYKSLFQEIFMVLKRTVGGNSRSIKNEAIQLSVIGKK